MVDKMVDGLYFLADDCRDTYLIKANVACRASCETYWNKLLRYFSFNYLNILMKNVFLIFVTNIKVWYILIFSLR